MIEIKNSREQSIGQGTGIDKVMEHVCDEICRHPRYAITEEELEESCENCKMRQLLEQIAGGEWERIFRTVEGSTRQQA